VEELVEGDRSGPRGGKSPTDGGRQRGGKSIAEGTGCEVPWFIVSETAWFSLARWWLDTRCRWLLESRCISARSCFFGSKLTRSDSQKLAPGLQEIKKFFFVVLRRNSVGCAQVARPLERMKMAGGPDGHWHG